MADVILSYKSGSQRYQANLRVQQLFVSFCHEYALLCSLPLVCEQALAQILATSSRVQISGANMPLYQILPRQDTHPDKELKTYSN